MEILKRYESCDTTDKNLKGMDNKMITYNVIEQSVEFFKVVKLIGIFIKKLIKKIWCLRYKIFLLNINYFRKLQFYNFTR